MRLLFTMSYNSIVLNIIPTLYAGYILVVSISAQNGYGKSSC